ncbi:carbohydrate binding family 9 domain-containing protein [bacterium]|nr:carbohydrate binding family 9 domain-containing protein [bacterium]
MLRNSLITFTFKSLMAGVLLLSPASLRAQSAAPGSDRSVSAYEIKGTDPLIDGKLDEDCWRSAPRTSGFHQREPVEGKPATLRTEVMFCYDDRALYIGAIMYVDDPAEIQSTLSRRDNTGNSARIIISLDTYRDRRTAYTYGVTADGVRFEYYHAEDDEFSRDYSYDPVWEARVQRGEKAWTAELRIPFSQLRFNERDVQIWGLNMNRYVPSRNEDDYWVLVPKNVSGWSSRFGTLEGIRGITPSSRIELTPYAVADLTLRRAEVPGNPYDKSTMWHAATGMDVKMGLGPNLTLDATINPDFGQVEADPADVNLSAYETYYSERRPFFIEGNQLLRGEGPDYFYSRRIGAPAHLTPRAQYHETPTNSTILGAGKISGRLANGLSFGALTAVTEREFVETYDPSTGRYGSEEVDPLSGFGVVRLQQEFGPDASTVGIALTGVERDLTSPAAEALLARQAVTGGADWKLRFDHGGFEIGGHAGFSHLRGSEAAMLRVQQSSAHYFQRPDADHISLDTATSLSGYSLGLSVEKNSGEHWLWELGGSAESPGFEINDVGRLQAADDIDSWMEVTYRENMPSALLHNYRFVFTGSRGWNFGGINQYTNLGLSAEATLKNFWNAALYFDYGLRALSDYLTRGGPLMETGAGWNVGFSLNNNFADDFRWQGYASYFFDEFDSWGYDIGGWIGLRTSGRLEMTVTPGYNRSVSTRQFVGIFDNGPAATYGSRYVFSTIDRATLYARFRINYAFTPDLTLEVYAEPFAASGKYLSFGELPAARSADLDVYGSEGSSIQKDETIGLYTVTDARGSFAFPDPDFNVLSFRSNIVLRWEWMRGSTLFFVWQQDRYNYDRKGNIISPVDLFQSFDTPGANFIAVKLTYWLPLT